MFSHLQVCETVKNNEMHMGCNAVLKAMDMVRSHGCSDVAESHISSDIKTDDMSRIKDASDRTIEILVSRLAKLGSSEVRITLMIITQSI